MLFPDHVHLFCRQIRINRRNHEQGQESSTYHPTDNGDPHSHPAFNERDDVQLLPKVKAEVVVSKVPVETVVNAAKAALYTGNIGDGKIFIFDVENVVKIRTGEVGYDALQGEDDIK